MFAANEESELCSFHDWSGLCTDGACYLLLECRELWKALSSDANACTFFRYYCVKLQASISLNTISSPRKKNRTPRVPPFNVIQDHRNWQWSTEYRSICDLKLTFQCNHRPILYRSKI